MRFCEHIQLIYEGTTLDGIPYKIFENPKTGQLYRAYDFELWRKRQEEAERERWQRGEWPHPVGPTLLSW